MSELLGSDEWFDGASMTKLLFRMLINSVVLFGIVYLHHRRERRWDYSFSFVSLNLITFALCFLLRKVPMDLGMGLGLFAVFGILRYRTETVGFIELTYLFIAIGTAVLNATANRDVSVGEIVAMNGVIFAATALLDGARPGQPERTHTVLYDRLDLIVPSERDALLADLTQRLGEPIVQVRIGRLDLLRDSVELTAIARSDRSGR